MPTARLYNESSYGITLYSGTPDQKLTFTSSPYNWLEASFFYSNIKSRNYCNNDFDPVCRQTYKDKGFNFKLRVKEEDIFPAIAIGINDIGGTGFYGSEYIVGSYGIQNLDFHFGLGWGTLGGSKNSFANPLGYISNSFLSRPDTEADVGAFVAGRYFSGEEISPFFGISFALNENILLKVESDTTLTPGQIYYEEPKSLASFGFDYSFNKNFSIGASHERGTHSSIRFIFKNDPKNSVSDYQYKPANIKNNSSKYKKLIANIENNGIGVNKIIESSKFIGLELTQFTHSNVEIIEEIIASAKLDSGIKKNVKTNLKIADLSAISNFDSQFENEAELIYKKRETRNFTSRNNFVFRPYLASREEFFKGALLIENNSEYVIKDNFFFSSNIKYSLLDNFDDLNIPSKTSYPAQVRSDVKDYLRNIDEGIIVGRAQLDYHLTLKKDHHFMLTAGVLEEMFSGYGFEYLYFKQDKNYALGFEVFDVIKRDYKMQFGTLDYKNITHSANFYYRNYDYIPFDMKISYGEYLAGDEGITFEISRSFLNGTKFGVFASLTDVSSEQFGEGSFDKGIFFNIPVYGNFINYSWRPLTKDPGAKLNRKHTLHDLLIKFKPYNY
jgi:hypothetical protein